MSISSSLNAGVMGLNANSVRLSTISDNIANSATTGYKRSHADFSSMVLQQRSSAYAAGGVRVHTYKDVGATGSLISTGNATDMAIGGRGLLPVTDALGVDKTPAERRMMLTPTGSFSPDQDGNLRTSSGLFLLGWPADTQGDIGNVSRSSGADLEPVNISASQFVASPTDRIDLGANLPADATRAGADGAPYDMPIEYFDNLGRAQTVSIRFIPEVAADGALPTNRWTFEIRDSADSPDTVIGTGGLSFIDDQVSGGHIANASAANGATYDADTGEITVNLAHGPVTMSVGRPGGSSGLTQFASSFSPNIVSKNGAPIGDLQSIEVDAEGNLEAIYNTGFKRTLYRIPVGDVANLNGLEALDGQSYAVSARSGNLFLWDAGQGPVGSIEGFALMESNTDIASELTDLIETQRAYSSNAKIVQTVDEMLQETTNLKR